MTSTDDAVAQVGDALRRASLSPNRVYVSEPMSPSAPRPPEGPWVVIPTADGCSVGAMGRGQFRTYAVVSSAEVAGDLVVRLLTQPARSVAAPDDAALAAGGAATGQAIVTRTGQRGGAPGPAQLQADDLLDVLGLETGHHLYALGTPFPQRSQPPTEGGEYHRYRVLAPLPDAQEGVAAPWFEQPGGGAMVVLARPIRWYVDEGYLVELV